jgi:DNA repair protein RecO (recombination protein O)
LSLKKTEALIVRDYDYRETSKIFEVFTPDHGLIRLVAKGIKRRSQRLAPLLQPFTHARLAYYQQDLSSMGILREAAAVEQFASLRGDLLRISLAYVFMEILMKGSGGKNEAVFRLALRFLRDLNAAPRRGSQATRRLVDLALCFLYRLLALLGYRPSLERCVGCKATSGLAGFAVGRGGALCRECLRKESEGTMELDLGTLKALRHSLSLPLSKLSSVHFSQRQTEMLLGLFLELARHYLEADIKSARFLTHVLNST